MKKHLLKATAVVAVVAVVAGLSTEQALAQSDASNLIRGGLVDANTIMNAYSSPMLKAFGAGLNGGWFNTAKPHGLGGFDVTLSVNGAFAPSSDQSFDINNLNLNNIRLKTAGDASTAPTIFGSDKEGPEVGVYGRIPGATQDSMLTSFKLPAGLGLNVFPLPTAQVAVGIGFGTEIAIRFVPTQHLESTSVGLFGFAIKHDFKRWIPGMKDMPFDLSAMFGYTGMNANMELDALEADQPSSTTYNPNPGKQYEKGKMDFSSNAWTANVLISKKLLFFTPYLGLGYQRATTTLKVNGTYPLTDINNSFDYSKGYGSPLYDANDPNSHPKIVTEVKDPISVEGVISGFRATAGFRLKLTILTIHADYTLATYNVASVGVGLNLQSIKPFKL